MDYKKIFKAYDVRGLYPQEIDETIAKQVGNAFARSFGSQGKILVGRDMRESSKPLSEAFIEGVLKVGIDVMDVGLCSTDMLYFASGKYSLPGVMFTASHNGPEFNGIKMCQEGASPIGSDSGLNELRDMALEEILEVSEEHGSIIKVDIMEDFINHVLTFIDSDQTLAGLNIVADVANGMGGLVVPKVFSRLKADVEVMYEELDGSFPNHLADPLQSENLNDLIKRVLETKADVGMAFDGDADRVFLVDDLGVPLPGWVVVAIVASSMLKHNSNETILYNLICSKRVPEIIEDLGGKSVKTRVGHSLIKKVMAETGAIFGGEHSGHYYFRDNFKADSGIIAALVLMQELKNSGVPLSILRKEYEVYFQSGEINFEVEDKDKVLAKLTAEFSNLDIDDMDGLTFTDKTWWCNVRPSNTEPTLRLNVEAETKEECDERISFISSIISASF